MTLTPAPSGVITLLSDFGTADPFVGVMKGAVLSRFRQAIVVDLCHGIRPQAIVEAAFWLERCYVWFPLGSVHVAVVDPGVGTARQLLAVASSGHFFLVPDNGLLPATLSAHPSCELRAVDATELGLATPSATFHGRDVFAPVAALLASGEKKFAELGPTTEALPCALAAAVQTATGFRGEVVTIDRYGNLITNIDAGAWTAQRSSHVAVGSRRLPLCRTYADAARGELVALINAFGVLEIAERDGSAERTLGCGRGSPVLWTLEAPF